MAKRALTDDAPFNPSGITLASIDRATDPLPPAMRQAVRQGQMGKFVTWRGTYRTANDGDNGELRVCVAICKETADCAPKLEDSACVPDRDSSAQAMRCVALRCASH